MPEISTAEAFELLEELYSTDNFDKIEKKIDAQLDQKQVSDFFKQQKCYFQNEPIAWKYYCNIFYIINMIITKIDVDSPDSLDFSQKNVLINAIENLAKNTLAVYVKQRNRTVYNTTQLSEDEYQKLISCLRMFHKLFSIKIVSMNELFDDFKINYIVGLIAVLSSNKTNEETKEFKEIFNSTSAQIGVNVFFKLLMMIKAFSGLSKEFQLIVNRELMNMIRGSNGFSMLCRNLLQKHDEKVYKKMEIISGIIEGATKNPIHRKKMISEVFRTLRECLTKDESSFIDACIFTLKSIEANSSEEMLEVIRNEILGQFKCLTNPTELLYGSILMEYCELKLFVDTLNALFSTSTIVSLPSKILHQHLTALFNLYSILPEKSNEKAKLQHVISFVLNNATKSELECFVRNLKLKDEHSKILQVHPRVSFKNNCLQIVEETNVLRDDSNSFMILVKNLNNNQLTFEIFICLLKMFGEVQNSSDTFLTGANFDENELSELLHQKFFKRLAVIEPLRQMLQWKSLHSQINERPKEIFEVMHEIFNNSACEDEHLTIIFFSLLKELLDKLTCDDQRLRLRADALKLSKKIKNENLRIQIEIIFDEKDKVPRNEMSKIAYDDAIKLLQAQEVHCKAYGSDTLIKLLKNREKQAVTNRHTILAIALQNMKEQESYIYLKIIKLLTALTYVMDHEVIDALIAEFENKEYDIDHRLKFGESIVKVTEDLGQMSAKFKQSLINCFLKGARDDGNEIRASSLANLGTICKILSYQIYNFFHEMFQQLEIILRGDEYLPSKRAAAMVLSNIISGIPNFIEFQEFLLPIYRILKEILATEDDEQTKVHASLGLECLNEKTKEFLNPQVRTQSEIKMCLNKISNEIKYK